MVYPCHSLPRISDLEIGFDSGSECKSKDETTQSISDIWTWNDVTAYIFVPKKSISDRDRYATAKFFWTFDYTLVLHCPNHTHHCQFYQ